MFSLVTKFKEVFNTIFAKKNVVAARPFLENYPSNTRYAESFRTLRTNIHFAFVEKKFRTLLITSAGPGEGKTCAVMNLAYTLAQAGRNVLMVDADLRKPVLSETVSSNNRRFGLTSVLSTVFGMDISSGSLSDIGTGDLIRLAALQKKTGILYLSDGDAGAEKLELFFLQGQLMDINWLTRPEEEKLATVLAREKLLTKSKAQKAFARQKQTGQKLGYILVNMGLLKEEEIKGPLTVHMIEGLRTALNIGKGAFSFKNLPESDFDRPFFSPFDFKHIFNQVIVGEENLPFLQEKVNAAILNTATKNLYILPSGANPANPSELLGSERMSFLIKFLQRRFDILIFDSPPLLPASDALVLSPQVDGVVLVVKSGLLKWKLVKNSLNQLLNAKVNVIGVALNGIEVKHKYYDKYYSGYYEEYA